MKIRVHMDHAIANFGHKIWVKGFNLGIILCDSKYTKLIV